MTQPNTGLSLAEMPMGKLRSRLDLMDPILKNVCMKSKRNRLQAWKKIDFVFTKGDTADA